MTDLVELAKRVEALDGPQFAIEREVWLAIGAPGSRPPNYTASLDAAMTLLDDDWFWRVGNDGEGADPSLYRADIGHPVPEKVMAFQRATAATPALALTAAALRALAAQGEG